MNISADHIERHKSLTNYINAKFKLLNFQTKQSFAYIKKNDELINKKIKIQSENDIIKNLKDLFDKSVNKHIL